MRQTFLVTVIVTFGLVISAVGCESAKPQIIATAVGATARLETPRVATIPPVTSTRIAILTPTHTVSPTRTPTSAPSPTSPRITIPPASTDEFEPDNRLEQAKPILVGGGAMTHTLTPAGDKDWIVFDAIEGIEYLIETFDVSSDISTDIVLLDQFERILARGQPDGNTSRLTWEPDYGDPYYLIISEHSTSQDTTKWEIKDVVFQGADSARSYRVRIVPNTNLVALATNNTKGELALINMRPARGNIPPVVTTIDLPQFVKFIEVTPSGKYAVVTMNDSKNHVAIVDLVTLRLLFTGGSGIDTVLTPTHDSNYAIVSSQSDDQFAIINLIPGPFFGRSCPIKLGQSVKSVDVTQEVPNNKYVLVTTFDTNGELVIIDINQPFCSPKFITPIKVDMPALIKSLKITPDNRFAVVVTNTSNQEVTVVDLATRPNYKTWPVQLGWTVQ